jgi:hypothetical protein
MGLYESKFKFYFKGPPRVKSKDTGPLASGVAYKGTKQLKLASEIHKHRNKDTSTHERAHPHHIK